MLAQQALDDGRGWQKFRALVSAQGGNVSYIDRPERLPSADLMETVPAPRAGYISGINARIVGETAVLLGAGRSRIEDPIDHAVGILVHHKVGDYLEEGEPLFTLHANRPSALEKARQEMFTAHSWSDDPVPPLPLFYGEVEGPES